MVLKLITVPHIIPPPHALTISKVGDYAIIWISCPLDCEFRVVIIGHEIRVLRPDPRRRRASPRNDIVAVG
jgi:hypothetical protein